MARFRFVDEDDDDDEGESDAMSIDHDDDPFANGQGTHVGWNWPSVSNQDEEPRALIAAEPFNHTAGNDVDENYDQDDAALDNSPYQQASLYGNQQPMENDQVDYLVEPPLARRTNNNRLCCFCSCKMFTLILTFLAGIYFLCFRTFLLPSPPEPTVCSSFLNDNNNNIIQTNNEGDHPLSNVCSIDSENRTYTAILLHHGSEIFQSVTGLARIFHHVFNHSAIHVHDEILTPTSKLVSDTFDTVTTPPACIFAQQPCPKDFLRRLIEQTPEIDHQPHGVQQMIHQLETDYWGGRDDDDKIGKRHHRRPTFFWIEAGSAGDLGVYAMAENMVQLIMPDCPKARPLPFANLSFTPIDFPSNSLNDDEDELHITLARMINRISDVLRPWKSHGGILLMEDMHTLKPTDLAKLLRVLLTTEIPFDSPLASFQEQMHGVLENVIFIFTARLNVLLMAKQFKDANGVLENVHREFLVQSIESNIQQHLRDRFTVPRDRIMPFWFQTMDRLNISIPLLLRRQVSAKGWNDIRLRPSMLERFYSRDKALFLGMNFTEFPRPVQITEEGFSFVRPLLNAVTNELEKNCATNLNKSLVFTMDYDSANGKVVLQSSKDAKQEKDDDHEDDETEINLDGLSHEDVETPNEECSFPYPG